MHQRVKRKLKPLNAVLWNLGYEIPGRINNYFVVFIDLSVWMGRESVIP